MDKALKEISISTYINNIFFYSKLIIENFAGSLEEEYHTKEDLLKYSERFYELCEICDDLPNVMWICTTEW